METWQWLPHHERSSCPAEASIPISLSPAPESQPVAARSGKYAEGRSRSARRNRRTDLTALSLL